MSKNAYIVLVVVVVLIVVGAKVYFANTDESSSSNNSSSPVQSTGTPIGTSLNNEEKEKGYVDYTDSGYVPGVLRVKKGDTVTFHNESSKEVWTASAMHPTHAVYPVTGGCIASAFDECKSDPPDSEWSFKFDLNGEWKYHNHVNPRHFGTIIVE